MKLTTAKENLKENSTSNLHRFLDCVIKPKPKR